VIKFHQRKFVILRNDIPKWFETGFMRIALISNYPLWFGV
jgi:hypothetical protein